MNQNAMSKREQRERKALLDRVLDANPELTSEDIDRAPEGSPEPEIRPPSQDYEAYFIKPEKNKDELPPAHASLVELAIRSKPSQSTNGQKNKRKLNADVNSGM
jgi:hypothetical protein